MAEVLPHRYAMVAVDQVQPHPRNPNRGDVDGIAEAIDAIGFYGALIVHGPTGNILAGSHRWVAAQSDGLAELPALIYDVDADTAEAIMVGDNEWSRRARWDMQGLVAVLTDLQAKPEHVAATGFDAERFAELVAKMNPAPPDAFPGYDDDLPTSYRCPSCGYEWAGQPRPGAVDPS